MKRILTPTLGLDQWRGLLGDPQKHWRRERSAFELAVSWERAQSPGNSRGLPCEVAAVIDTSDALKDAELLFGLPEHKVALASKGAPSQTDLWALLQNETGFG
jgi:hypothetical protein